MKESFFLRFPINCGFGIISLCTVIYYYIEGIREFCMTLKGLDVFQKCALRILK